MLPRLLLGTAAALLLAAPAASASSVAYTEGGNVVLSSADGARKLALTTDGTPVSPYYTPAQSANGVTVAARQEQFDSMRAVLHAWSAWGGGQRPLGAGGYARPAGRAGAGDGDGHAS